MPTERIIDEQQILTETGFFWREKDGVKVLVCRALEDAGFANGVSTRGGGVSPFPENSLNLSGFDDDSAENIKENRRRFIAVFGDYELAVAWQTHGTHVRLVRDRDDIQDSEQRADAVMSDLINVLAGVKTADCVPILLGDTQTNAFAAVHAGWKGSVRSIAKIAIEKMREIYGTEPKNLIAAIGPAACGRNYEVGREVIDQFNSNFQRASVYFTPTREGHALVDLHAANRDQLIDAGVLSNNIYTAPFCTMERADLFFSYRREKGDFGKTGRLLSVIGRVI